MRRLDKEIWKHVSKGDLSKAFDIADRADYYVEVYDGDVETGPLPPVVVEVSRRWPDLLGLHYGRNY